MTLNLTIPNQQHTDFSPRITVVGVGGGGTNAVNNMVTMGLEGVEFLVANTDAQSLQHSKADRRVQLGSYLTQGLGAGAKPEIGRGAAEEAETELARHLEGSHMVFVTAGMGGGTGTGAAPVIARMARERGILTVGVVTKPFDFEGPKRRKAADAGIEELQQFVDTLIVIPNQNLFRLANERTTFAEAFRMADNVLYMGVRGVTDLMVNPGLVNLDFADIRTVMAEMGKAMMGTGEAEGEGRAVKASEEAISNPLLEDTSMHGARGVLINITGGLDMTLFEVDEAANRIRKEVDEEANVIFGSSVDESMNGRIRVSVVATGIDAREAREAERPKLVAVGGGGSLQAVSSQQVAQHGQPQAPQPAMRAPAGFTPRVAAQPQPQQPQHQQPQHPGAMRPAQTYAAPQPMQQAPATAAPMVEAAPGAEAPVSMAPQAEPGLRAPAGTRPVAPMPQAQPTGGLNNLFRRATGLMRRDVPEPQMQPAQQPRMEPAARPVAPPTQQDEMGLDIPTFLRRQSN
ncbi:cell division protein FtsZ [Roseomonas frigidaquae]|uniref:Cell division protein FtsZ n=1 Tax=Falsiroseomonas frigidaquae TaxID=487318 RepID=A0ABX1F843_9PROT|nr:cell division protein FtsZ [Falsiroseomonas frigidaquae]NKE48391.1 cell division protein FtsZ [Falsiroseomonas frigidaquae]